VTGPVGWFPDVNADVLTMLIGRYEIRSVIEIGSFVGKSAVWFARQGLDVVTIDRFDAAVTCDYLLTDEQKQAASDQYHTFLRNTLRHRNIRHVVGDSADVAGLPIVADMVYIDGSHDYPDVKRDIDLWTPHAIKVVCGDDNTRVWPGVQRAVAEVHGANRDTRLWWKSVTGT
jgi:predicted O-methyltransferase YrrM